MASVCGLAFCVWWWWDSLPFSFPPRQLSRRSLRQVLWILCEIFYFLTLIIFSHAKTAESAKFYLPSVFHACAGVVANFVTTRVRREFCPPPPPCGVLPPVSGGESVTTDGYTPYSSPLRPLSRVASDYFSGSVVFIGTLRPLRFLREIKRQSSLICGLLSVRTLYSVLC